MARVLIIGGTKFIGREVARQLAERGDEVVLFNRGTTDPAPGFRQVTGNVAELPAHADELRALRPDAIVHCIAYSEQDAERAIETFSGVACPLIALSSQDCYEAFHSWQVGRELTDFPIDEDMALAQPYYWRKRGHPSHSSAEEYDKNLMTDVLLNAGERGEVAPVVLRLPMVWGPGDPHFQHRHGDVIWHLLDERTTMVLGEREQAQIWTFGYIDNVAAAIVHAIDRAALGSVYNVGEVKVRTKRRWADLYARSAGISFEYRLVPDVLVDPEAESNGHAFHMITDNTRFVADTGFREPVGLEDGISRTLEWSRANRGAVAGRPNYDLRDAAVRKCRELVPGS